MKKPTIAVLIVITLFSCAKQKQMGITYPNTKTPKQFGDVIFWTKKNLAIYMVFDGETRRSYIGELTEAPNCDTNKGVSTTKTEGNYAYSYTLASNNSNEVITGSGTVNILPNVCNQFELK